MKVDKKVIWGIIITILVLSNFVLLGIIQRNVLNSQNKYDTDAIKRIENHMKEVMLESEWNQTQLIHTMKYLNLISQGLKVNFNTYLKNNLILADYDKQGTKDEKGQK